MIVKLPAYILSGGRSSRFGSDKARAELGGTPLVRRLADMLAPHVSRVTVVADIKDKYQDLDLATIADRLPGLGPIGGLHAALSDLRSEEPWLLLTSCDLITINGHWIDGLLLRAEFDVPCVAYRWDRWEPLLALYHSSITGMVEERIHAGQTAMQDLLDAARAEAMPLPGDWPQVPQVNTPGDLRAAAEQHGS